MQLPLPIVLPSSTTGLAGLRPQRFTSMSQECRCDLPTFMPSYLGETISFWHSRAILAMDAGFYIGIMQWALAESVARILVLVACHQY